MSTSPKFRSHPRRLAIHLTFRCFHHCNYCAPRQEFFRPAQHAMLPLEIAKQVISEAYSLGVKEFQLSGGDPLLYEDLVSVIKHIKSLDSTIVYMNSVGTGLKVSKATDIINAGLDGWNFSIDSLNPEIHNHLRGVNGAFEQSLSAINLLRKLRQEMGSTMRISLLTVISRLNFEALPDIFSFALEQTLDSIYLMNLYGEAAHDIRLTAEQIKQFKYKVIPEILNKLQHCEVSVIQHVSLGLSKLFSSNCGKLEDFAAGRYWLNREQVDNTCDVPKYSMIVEADGRVIPCCGGEINGNLVLGNLLKDTLGELWNGPGRQFDESRFDYCLECPSKQNQILWLTPKMISST